jgi:transposase-like protein
MPLSKIDKLLLASGKRKKKWKKFCPLCKSTDVTLDARMEMVWYKCRKCGYQSATFPEKEKK